MTDYVFQEEMWSTIRLVVIFAFVLVLVRLRQGRKAKGTKEREEETRTIQELYRGFERMEERVEALETLLIERDKRSR